MSTLLGFSFLILAGHVLIDSIVIN